MHLVQLDFGVELRILEAAWKPWQGVSTDPNQHNDMRQWQRLSARSIGA
jgi:hypothetical protein